MEDLKTTKEDSKTTKEIIEYWLDSPYKVEGFYTFILRDFVRMFSLSDSLVRWVQFNKFYNTYVKEVKKC